MHRCSPFDLASWMVVRMHIICVRQGQKKGDRHPSGQAVTITHKYRDELAKVVCVYPEVCYSLTPHGRTIDRLGCRKLCEQISLSTHPTDTFAESIIMFFRSYTILMYFQCTQVSDRVFASSQWYSVLVFFILQRHWVFIACGLCFIVWRWPDNWRNMFVLMKL